MSPESKKSCQDLENHAGIWKISSVSAFFFWNLKIFTKNCWNWADLAKSHQIQPDLVEISPDLIKSGLILQVWSDFLYNSNRVRVARVLEKQTHHSTRRCRFLRTKTRRRSIGLSVWAGIGSPLGGLARLSGFDRVCISLTPAHEFAHRQCLFCLQQAGLLG